jgi:ribosomal protein S12 methylthiotransferase
MQDILSSLKLIFNPEVLNQRHTSTPGHYSYLKISEGCSRKCAFCAIPAIRGKHVSRRIEDIVEEARYLSEHGTRELLLIAQDLSYYGRDLYRESRVVALLKELLEINKIKWIRLHYAYPEGFPEGLIELMAQEQKICNYLDIPFQHINDKMLKMMNRGYTSKDTYRIIEQIRSRIPDAALRTSLIVGHPGEGEKEFAELVDFVKSSRFERLGVFTYSPEEGTRSGDLYPDEIPEEVKQERYAVIMELQKEISAEINAARVGKTEEVLIDRKEGEYFVGRTQYDSPEVDQEILVTSPEKHLKTGSFYHVRITDSDDYDLYGEIV